MKQRDAAIERACEGTGPGLLAREELASMVNREKARADRLLEAIENAPHSIGCAHSIRRGHCDCWKRKALEGE